MTSQQPHRTSKRLRNWDYRSLGWYFVTICTADGESFFGEIRNGLMGLSELGCMAWYYWRLIPQHHNHVMLDAFIVMPNHVHGIVGITSRGNSENNDVGTCHGMSLPITGKPIVSNISQSKFGKPQSNSLSIIINHYKGALTRWCRQNDHGYFAWQPRFYDHVIRNKRSFERIRGYILNNPLRWETDREYPYREQN